MTRYTDIDTLANVYVEDSFVLKIDESPDGLRFTGEFVLTEQHPAYHAPAPDEQYCYAEGYLIIPNTARLEWSRRSDPVSFDATGEHDLGSIDYFNRVDDHWLIGGEWGEARVYNDNPYLVLTRASDT